VLVSVRVRCSTLHARDQSWSRSVMAILPGRQEQWRSCGHLEPDLVSSDVHECLELLKSARTLDRPATIQTYDEPLELVHG
jgi:hypothetical protein